MNRTIQLKYVLIALAVITLLGFILHSFSGNERFHIPDSFEIGKKSNLLMGLVILYFVLAFVILYLFIQPKTPGGTAAVLGGSILWSIY